MCFHFEIVIFPLKQINFGRKCFFLLLLCWWLFVCHWSKLLCGNFVCIFCWGCISMDVHCGGKLLIPNRLDMENLNKWVLKSFQSRLRLEIRYLYFNRVEFWEFRIIGNHKIQDDPIYTKFKRFWRSRNMKILKNSEGDLQKLRNI